MSVLASCVRAPARSAQLLPAAAQEDLSRYPPDSPAQQEAVLKVADGDGFNWGYDPVHWGVPEGSYATDPDGVARCGHGVWLC